MSLELTPNERKLLDSMEKHVSVKEAALAAGLNPKYANQYTQNVRRKIREARAFLAEINTRRKKSRLVNKTLGEKQ